MGLLKVIISTALMVLRSSQNENSVLVLTDKNFQDHLKAHKNLLILFYAPYCHHSQKLLPLLDEAARDLENANS